jgi:hypothetical protein
MRTERSHLEGNVFETERLNIENRLLYAYISAE